MQHVKTLSIFLASCFLAQAGSAQNAPVQSSRETKTWCADWKQRKVCGSVSDFELFAQRKCLEAQANEDISISQIISGWGDCAAAKIMSAKISFMASRHEDATGAQKKLDALPPGPAWEQEKSH
jgi:hypothetical protein